MRRMALAVIIATALLGSATAQPLKINTVCIAAYQQPKGRTITLTMRSNERVLLEVDASIAEVIFLECIRTK